MIGSINPHLVKGMAPGGGRGPPPLGKGGPPEEESDEYDTDEETVSLTSSSQVSAGRMRPWKWG